MPLDKLIVMGGTRLKGSISVSGAKNAVLPIMAAGILNDGESIIHNVPNLEDVKVMIKVLEAVGAKVKKEGTTLIIDSSTVNSYELSDSLVRKMRASNLVMGALAAKFGTFKTLYPGGCNIGSRPIDLHLKGLERLGLKTSEGHGYIEGKSSGLVGNSIHLDFPSVGATENIMMAACMAKGKTIIRNAAREPEIVDLQNFLNSMGANVKGAGLDVIKIEGVKKLKSSPVEHTVIPDRIEAGTHMVAAAITGGDVEIKNIIVEHVEPVISKLRECGASISNYNNCVRVTVPGRIRANDFRTLPYPGFPTDMQPQIMALMSLAQGTSVISESIFDNRFKHVDELRRMGADIKVEGRVAIVTGTERLTGAFVEATDLRAGAALVLAGLAAEDATVIENIYHIDRGYDNLEKKYSQLGAKIIRVSNSNGSN